MSLPPRQFSVDAGVCLLVLSDYNGDMKQANKLETKERIDIETIKADIAFIRGGLKREIAAEEFSVLERRVALLEKRR